MQIWPEGERNLGLPHDWWKTELAFSMTDAAIHRYTQPPSKVLHVRNLPYEVTHEELAELCEPFGKILQSKLHVGPNKNQAFVEFPDTSQAISMVTYFGNSADPAKVRGKTVYLQYSTRGQITNSTSAAEQTSNVLLVSLEDLAPNCLISLDTLYVVFSAFGEVHKIATFEKQGGLQALVQYADIHVAQQVRRDLDGRHIPRHLLDNSVNPPMMKLSYSQHTDLNVKFQSNRSRDYTNALLPVAPTGMDPTLSIQAPQGPSEGGYGNPRSNVLHCTIENMAYPITIEALHTVFSPYGNVQKITIFEKNGLTQALVQFPDEMIAEAAKQVLEGHAVYDGGFNRLKLGYSIHRELSVRCNGERSWDYTTPSTGRQPGAPMSLAPPPGFGPGPGPQGNFGTPQGGYGGPRPQGNMGPSPRPQPRWNEIPNMDCTGREYEAAHATAIRAARAAAGGAPITPTAAQAAPALAPGPQAAVQPYNAAANPQSYPQQQQQPQQAQQAIPQQYVQNQPMASQAYGAQPQGFPQGFPQQGQQYSVQPTSGLQGQAQYNGVQGQYSAPQGQYNAPQSYAAAQPQAYGGQPPLPQTPYAGAQAGFPQGGAVGGQQGYAAQQSPAGPMYVQKQGSYGQQGYPAPGPGFAQPQAAFSQGQQFPNTPSQPPWQGGQAQGFY